MPATNSGRIVKTRKVKKGTLHQKNHRWESFTTKVSKLNSLDPIRRVRRHDLDAEDLSTTTSYFKSGLEKWQDLNMSEGFVAFSQEVLKMCDSLPQILHFEDQIMENLVTYMEKRERESMEPLLELVTDFAHDLGGRFMRHFPKVLEVVTSIAGTPQDVEVIEWSFTCLTFMFKYLSRHLVLDLKPTYDLMAPLLGKHRQPPHIARFAAEAMSFLITKAGAPARREECLPLIVLHAKSDLASISGSKEFGLYYHGIMTMFAQAMKGNGWTVHTSGAAIFQCLISVLDDEDFAAKEPSPWMNVIFGVLTSIIHQTNSGTFKDIMDIVIGGTNEAAEAFQTSKTKADLGRLLLFARTIGIVSGVRKASRVNDWPALLEAMSGVLRAISKNVSVVSNFEPEVDIWSSLVLSVSIILQYVPMDAMIRFISPFMDSLTKDPLATWFLPFCSYLSDAEPERFRAIVLPYFQRFVIAHWSDARNGDTLSVLLPKMVSSGVLPTPRGKEGFTLPQSWQDQIVSKFEKLEVSPFPEQASPAIHDRSPTTWHDRCLPKYNALLEVLASTVVHPSTNARISEILLRKLKLALRPSSSLAPEEANFIVGRGFSAFSRMSKGAGELDRALEPLLRAAAPRYARLPDFLEALLDYQSSLKASPNPKPGLDSKEPSIDGDEDLLITSLVANLSTDSHELRLLSLRLLDHIYTTDQNSTSEALSIMLMVEQTPLDLQTARSASMHIRKVASLYSHQSPSSWLKQAIPLFCFGMLTVKFSQLWEDACAALKQIAETKSGEEAVGQLAFEWLETPSAIWDGSARTVEQSHNNGLTDFECSNLMKLDQLAKEADAEVANCRDTMLQKFEDAQKLVADRPTSARAQALRILAGAPAIAEKRSRQLVPMFLSWASKQIDEIEPSDGEAVSSGWTRKDQKSQLDLFGLFVNSVSLFRAADVHSALLKLLANGDIEIQKSALKAIFTWKNGSIKPYEENLLNLLDEARFKDEITILLQGQTLVQAEHREALMPVLLRILYGRSISRKGSASGRQGMEARRLTVLRSLNARDVEGFLDIALGELQDIHLVENGIVQDSMFDTELLGVRKQVGLTNMMEGFIKELGTKVTPFAGKLVQAVLYCTIFSSRQLQGDTEDIDEGANQVTQTSLLKVVRQTGLKSLILLFSNATSFDWSPYLSSIINDVVGPRLENLPIETGQSISAILRLLSTWSSTPQTVLFLGSHKKILSKVAECLAPQKSKDEVKLIALNILRNVVKLGREDESNGVHDQVKSELLTPNMDHFLTQIGGVLRGQHDLSKDLLESCVTTVSELAPFVSTSTQAHNLVDVSIFLLDQPSRRVNPKTKGGLLLVLEHFVPLYDLQNDAELKDKVYHTVTSLFGFFKDKASREVLSRVLLVYAQRDPVIEEVASICVDLNSFAVGRLDEPDYDRRLKAFNVINSPRDVAFTARQWTPLLYNMLYYIRHDEEFGILSSNSSDGICQFINTAGKAEEESEQAAFKGMLSSILLPALFSGAREPSEVIRREYLKVMAHLVRTFSTWSEVSDMHSLLAGDDELESSFFNNILTAGKGRQSSALGQVAAAAERGELSGKSVSHFFVPIIEHFIFDRAEGNEAHNLAAEATTTIGILSGSLEWPQYRAMLRRFIGYVEGKPDLEKQIIRLLGKVIDALALVAQAPDATSDAVEDLPRKRSTLAVTIPKGLKLADDLTSNILPPLTKYLHHKDESTVSLRVPVAVIIVRLLKLLPEDQLTERLPPVLTDICHILRSKAQESRDMTRDTLTKICVLLGPSCFGFVLKELRGALARGSQLHVLSYTMHSLLVATTPEYAPGDLDYCLPSIVAIIMDDIFGATGQEKDAEEYVSKMKEVKSSKSQDSMELIAKTATLSRLTDLVKPIQVLLKEKLNLKMVRKIDELLNRISSGLLKNSAAQSRDSLIFCYEVIQDVYNAGKPEQKVKSDYRLKRYLVQKGAKKSGQRGSTTIYTYKLVRFAFDVLRSVLKKYDNLRTSSNLADFIEILGDAVVEAEEEVKVSAFRLLATIVKVPLKIKRDETIAKKFASGTDLYRIAAAEATRSISASSTTTSDIAQASLKLLSVILRDRQDVTVKDTAVDELLTRLKDDMTEPERRHVTFNFLRAVMDAKVQTAVVYDTLDYVGTVMVTNDDKDTRDLARGAYFQFLRDYPQQKNRWTKQLGFIVANLKYEREGGRLSILEVIHLLLAKSSDEFVQEVSATCFVPLIFVLANDDSEKCRMAAGEVLKEIFKKADHERMTTFLTLLRSWIKQGENTSVVRLALQTYGFYYESHGKDDGDVSMLQESILVTVKTAEDSESDWEQIYAALQLATILVQKFPDTLLSSKAKSLWSAIRNCLSFPHAWVKLSAVKLISIYFAHFARNNIESKLEGLPLKGSGGLKLSGDDISELIRRIAHMFKTPGLTALLADEVVKNLVFLGRCAAANDLMWRSAQKEGDSDDEDEEVEKGEKQTALGYLFGRLSFILRKETSPPRASALVPKTSALQLLQHLTNHLSPAQLAPSLQSIILPLHNLTDSSIAAPYSTDETFRTSYEELKTNSEEIMESLKKKCGTKEYSEALLRVREGVRRRREMRRGKRRIEAVSMPERFGEQKRKKVERKKERRKERGREHQGRRNEW
ncbi:U3 small nucleolar RNA-associated protein [Lachnellula hyalina]|uniref:U3 small nucleolar RNA-associated protein n=1 Tax=Lachnellula hyalina TaxID=1316788 RepID=A0A8H8R3X2_9HELO|nr:U3 small nucleolar RNA-associated protein [Lachnellula hyalina]TVY27908.1 U3 small nucleolar RNA-associated protein [Lachnellula hyalina]